MSDVADARYGGGKCFCGMDTGRRCGRRNAGGDKQGTRDQVESHAERTVNQLGGETDQDEGHEDGRIGQQFRGNARSPPC